MGGSFNDSFLLGLGFEDSKTHPSSRIAQAIDLYFQYCHRQPIWCFDHEEVKDPTYMSEELVCSILTLTSRFSQERDEMQHFGDTARTLVMLRIANGTVDLETSESLCLLAYSSFLGISGSFTSPGVIETLTETRWQPAPWTIPPWSCASTLSLSNVGPQLHIRRRMPRC